MDILIKLFDGGKMPEKALPKASCYDCFASWWKQDKDLITIGLGFATEFSEQLKGCIVPRSSFTKLKAVMQNSPAQIESDYRGEWIVKFRVINRSLWHTIIGFYPNPFDFSKAICQIYFEGIAPTTLKLTNQLTESERGSGGFGHTDIVMSFK